MLPLQITLHHTTLSPDVERQVRARAERLARYYDRIAACRVTVDVPQTRRHSDAKRYGVRIALTVPGGKTVISRQPRADLMTEVQRAFDAARRRLQDRARHLRGEVKHHEPLEDTREE